MEKTTSKSSKNTKLRALTGVEMLLVSLLIAAVAAMFIFAKSTSERSYVSINGTQVIALDDGTVIKGDVSRFGKDYLVVDSATLSKAGSNDVSTEQLIVNRQHVVFWKNGL
jgi:hypothetical protein